MWHFANILTMCILLNSVEHVFNLFFYLWFH